MAEPSSKQQRAVVSAKKLPSRSGQDSASQDRLIGSGTQSNSLLYQHHKSPNRRGGAGINPRRGMKLANINLDGAGGLTAQQPGAKQINSARNLSSTNYDFRGQQSSKQAMSKRLPQKNGPTGHSSLKKSKGVKDTSAALNQSTSILSQKSNSWQKAIKHDETKSVSWFDWFCGTCTGTETRNSERYVAHELGRAPMRLESFGQGSRSQHQQMEDVSILNGSESVSQGHRSVHNSSMMFNKQQRGLRPPRYTNEELDAAIFDENFGPPSGISKENRKISSTDLEEEKNALAEIPSPQIQSGDLQKTPNVNLKKDQNERDGEADGDMSSHLMMDVDEATPGSNTTTALQYTDRNHREEDEEAGEEQRGETGGKEMGRKAEGQEGEQRNNFEMHHDSSISSDTSIPEETPEDGSCQLMTSQSRISHVDDRADDRAAAPALETPQQDREDQALSFQRFTSHATFGQKEERPIEPEKVVSPASFPLNGDGTQKKRYRQREGTSETKPHIKVVNEYNQASSAANMSQSGFIAEEHTATVITNNEEDSSCQQFAKLEQQIKANKSKGAGGSGLGIGVRSSHLNSSHDTQEVVISSIDFKGANQQLLKARDDELAEFERLEAEVLLADQKRNTVTEHQFSEKTTPVDPFGGPRVTSNLKKHSSCDEMNPNELLQEQVAQTVTPGGDPNELNFELDQSFDRSSKVHVYSECGNKLKKGENDLGNFEDQQSRHSQAKNNDAPSESLEECVNIQADHVDKSRQQAPPVQMFPPPQVKTTAEEQQVRSKQQENPLAGQQVRPQAQSRAQPKDLAANNSALNRNRKSVISSAQKGPTAQGNNSRLKQPSSNTQKRGPNVPGQRAGQGNQAATNSSGNKTQDASAIDDRSADISVKSQRRGKQASPAKMRIDGDESSTRMQAASRTEQRKQAKMNDFSRSADNKKLGLSLQPRHQSAMKSSTNNANSASQLQLGTRQRSLSNIGGTAKKEQASKKSMNDVFAKYASVAQITLGKSAHLSKITVQDTSQDESSLNDAMRELAKSIRSDSQTRLAGAVRERSMSRKSVAREQSLLTDSNTQITYQNENSQASVTGFGQQKKNQQQDVSMIPTHAVIEERPPTNCTDIYSDTGSKSYISGLEARKSPPNNDGALSKRTPRMIGKAGAKPPRRASMHDKIDAVLHRYNDKERVDPVEAQERAMKELRKSIRSSSQGSKNGSNMGSRRNSQAGLKDAEPVASSPKGLMFGATDNRSSSLNKGKRSDEMKNRQTGNFGEAQPRDRSITQYAQAKGPPVKEGSSNILAYTDSAPTKKNAYGQADRSPRERSSEATSLMTAQFGQKQSQSPSIRQQLAQANAANQEVKRVSSPHYEGKELPYEEQLQMTQKQKQEIMTKRKISLLMNHESYNNLKKTHSVNQNSLPTLEEIENFKKEVTKKQPQSPKREPITPTTRPRQNSTVRSSAKGSPSGLRKTRSKATGFFTAQGGTGRRSVTKDAIQQQNGGPIFRQAKSPSKDLTRQSQSNVRRSVSPRNRTMVAPRLAVNKSQTQQQSNTRSSSVMQRRSRELGDASQSRSLSRVQSQHELSSTKDLRLRQPPKIVVKRFDNGLSQQEKAQAVTARASMRQRSPALANRPSQTRLGTTQAATRQGQTALTGQTQSRARLKPAAPATGKTMTMNGLTLTARQPETTRRTGKKYGASTGVYDVQGSNLLAVVGKTRLGQPATEETKKAPAQARVNTGLRGTQTRARAQGAQSGTQAQQRATVARASVTIAASRVQKSGGPATTLGAKVGTGSGSQATAEAEAVRFRPPLPSGRDPLVVAFESMFTDKKATSLNKYN